MNIKHHNWHIFCAVVDNFGDIGVCWRFARQLAGEFGQAVCLWVDDLHSFRRICPEIQPEELVQHCRGVEIRRWSVPLPTLTLIDMPDVLVEAFACTIPDSYLQLLAQKSPVPLWFNMEYLSAEDWILGCHTLASPHPQYKLIKTFFFPGFVAGTGGLLCEQNLLAERDKFQASCQQQADFWHTLNMPSPSHDELRLSLFGYDNPVDELVALWAKSSTPISLCVPEGKLAQQLVSAMQSIDGSIEQSLQQGLEGRWLCNPLCRGQLVLYVLPFMEQDQYDRLLWACDINFVRGEDSFVRAQWAGRPLVWQIYRQEENVHLQKLAAFLGLYREGLADSSAYALQQFWQAWNTGEGIAEAWPAFVKERESLQIHAATWLKIKQKNGDFTTNMMIFCQKYL